MKTTPSTMDHNQSATNRSDPHSGQNRPMSIEEIRASYADAADWLHRFEWVDRLLTGSYRRKQFGSIERRVLDVACGGGTNFRYLPPTVDLVGIDISPEMLNNAQARLDELPIDGSLHQMDAQDLRFPDDSFDVVVSALSTCTFPDPVAALQEMARVCKPGGQILLVEHGKSDVGVIARYQQWRADAHYEKLGCRWTQDPLSNVKRAGLPVKSASTGFFGMITAIKTGPQSLNK